MGSHTGLIVPPFDFTSPERLSERERLRICLERAKEIVSSNGYQDISDFPCVPETGASDAELQTLESQLGISLPADYRRFLSLCRYLKLDDGQEVGGFDHAGLFVAQPPWVSDQHRKGVEYLVFANYWQYADGDQLMFDLSEPGTPVIAYLHEHGPLFEMYAPNFSFALWRLVHE
jgi:hypothetical protein